MVAPARSLAEFSDRMATLLLVAAQMIIEDPAGDGYVKDAADLLDLGPEYLEAARAVCSSTTLKLLLLGLAGTAQDNDFIHTMLLESAQAALEVGMTPNTGN